jgi:hypothetical protein
VFSGTTDIVAKLLMCANRQPQPCPSVSEVDGRLLGDSEAWLQAGGQGRHCLIPLR